MNALAEIFDDLQMGHALPEIRQESVGKRSYIICVIPRSGSSWLAEILRNTGVLGNPREWFNPEPMRLLVNQWQCTTLWEYVDTLHRQETSDKGIFGVKIGFYHLEMALQLCSLQQLLGNAPTWFYLTRVECISAWLKAMLRMVRC